MEPQFYKGNRDAFMEKLEPGSLALFFSGSPVRKTADEDYGYFANRNFVYLTGMEQKDTVLMMEKDASGYRETLFILPPNLIEERWTGSRMKPEEIEAVSMISSFAYKETFEEELKKVLTSARDCYNIVRTFGNDDLKAAFAKLQIEKLPAMISEVRAASRGIYGAPKVFQELKKAGVRTSRKRVARIMRDNGWAGTTRGCAKRPKGEAKQAAPQPCAAPDLVRRDFAAGGPNEVWFADITYVRTHQGWPCLAVLMDVWSRRVVGWSMSARMTAELADDALRMAIARRRPPEGCIHHSDHGSQYASLLLGKTMREAGIEPSMGSISSPWDNAAMESLMGVIKAECVHARTFESRDQAALEIFEYIECFYNRVRTHSALGYLSPEEFERANWPEEDRHPMAA